MAFTAGSGSSAGTTATGRAAPPAGDAPSTAATTCGTLAAPSAAGTAATAGPAASNAERRMAPAAIVEKRFIGCLLERRLRREAPGDGLKQAATGGSPLLEGSTR